MDSTDLEFEHFLAVKLSMTVGELRRRMSQAEYMRWGIYYGREAQRKELASLMAKKG